MEYSQKYLTLSIMWYIDMLNFQMYKHTFVSVVLVWYNFSNTFIKRIEISMSRWVFEPKHILDWYCMIYNWGGLQTKKIEMSGGCYEGLGFRSINNHWAGFPSKDDQVRLTSLCVLPRSFRLLCLDLLLNLGLLIELVEVVHDDRDRQRDAENSTNCTNLEKKGNCLILQLISTFQTKHRKESS